MAETRVTENRAPAGGATPALIRWGAVFGGVVIGLSLLLLLSILWVALAFGTGVEAIETNLNWFVGVSAIVSMFVGGLLAGWLSGVPGFAPGFFNGLTVWGLIVIATVAMGTPGALQFLATAAPDTMNMTGIEGQAVWAAFASLLVGAIAAGAGGGVGGMTTRPAFIYAAPERGPRHLADEDRERQRVREEDERRRERAADHPAEPRDPALEQPERPPAYRDRPEGDPARPPAEQTIQLPEDEHTNR
jgi:hypothetical protein